MESMIENEYTCRTIFHNIHLYLCQSDTDYSMVTVMIIVYIGDKNLLNVSHQAGRATLNITEYHSNDSIVIEMYGINNRDMISNCSTKEMVKLGRAWHAML